MPTGNNDLDLVAIPKGKAKIREQALDLALEYK